MTHEIWKSNPTRCMKEDATAFWVRCRQAKEHGKKAEVWWTRPHATMGPGWPPEGPACSSPLTYRRQMGQILWRSWNVCTRCSLCFSFTALLFFWTDLTASMELIYLNRLQSNDDKWLLSEIPSGGNTLFFKVEQILWNVPDTLL